MKSQIVKQARLWIGTKFQHQGRIRKTKEHEGGCDCLGLIMGVAKELRLKTKYGDLINELDQLNYNSIPNSQELQSQLSNHFITKDKKDISPGDLALFSLSKNPQHLAIIGILNYASEKKLTLIHAYSTVGYVCEHILDDKWYKRLSKLCVYSCNSSI